MKITHLSLKWTISRARDTFGANLVTLTDGNTGKKYRAVGSGYDLTGTVFAEWLADTHQAELLKIAHRSFTVCDKNRLTTPHRPDSLYAMYHHVDSGKVSIDGGCGIESVLKIAAAIGLEVEREAIRTGRNKGQTIGYFV